MILDEIKKIDSSVKKLREFGYLVGGILTVLGLLAWWRGRAHFPFFLFPGILLVAAGFVFPKGLKPFQKTWMTIAVLMGWVMTRVLLSVLFYVALTPLSLFLRMTGQDLLNLRFPSRDESCWKACPKISRGPGDYEKQF